LLLLLLRQSGGMMVRSPFAFTPAINASSHLALAASRRGSCKPLLAWAKVIMSRLLLSATGVSKMAWLAADRAAPWPPASSSSSPAAPVWFAVLVAVGLFVVVRSAATFLAWLRRAFLRPGRDLAARYGAWAVVTGATDGIGRAVALELARRGLHLVLVGRSPGKLARVGKEVRAAAPSCEVRAVAFDLAATGADARRGVARVAAAVEGRDVGLLVNNAGATYPCAAYFHEVEEAVWEAVVRVNVEAATRITRAVLPLMAARGRGAVVNVGSGSSVVVPAFPLYAVYAASKA